MMRPQVMNAPSDVGFSRAELVARHRETVGNPETFEVLGNVHKFCFKVSETVSDPEGGLHYRKFHKG